jgi:hypothetical protein
LVASAICRNIASSMPGTSASHESSMRVIAKPPF